MKKVSFFDVSLKLARMRKSQYVEITETVKGKVIRTYRKNGKAFAMVYASLSNSKENEYFLAN